MATAINNSTPVGVIKSFAGSIAPAGFLLCYGQALSTITHPEYTALYNMISADGFPYGGTNNTNFQVPDLRGRTPAGKDNMGGTTAARLTAVGSGITGTILGNAGGVEAVTLSAAQSGVPAHSHENTLTEGIHQHTVDAHDHGGGTHNHNYRGNTSGGGLTNLGGALGAVVAGGTSGVSDGYYNLTGGTGFQVIQDTSGFLANQSPGSSNPTNVTPTSITNVNNSASSAASPHSVAQPTIVLNYIIKY